MGFMKDRIDDILVQVVSAMNTSIETMHRGHAIMGEVIDNTVDMDHLTHDMSDITATLEIISRISRISSAHGSYFTGKHCFRRSALLVDSIGYSICLTVWTSLSEKPEPGQGYGYTDYTVARCARRCRR